MLKILIDKHRETNCNNRLTTLVLSNALLRIVSSVYTNNEIWGKPKCEDEEPAKRLSTSEHGSMCNGFNMFIFTKFV